MNDADVIIAGAGPAGCIFALTLDEKISVVILEKEPKKKLGHDWIDGFDLRIVKDYEFVKYVEKIADSADANFYAPDGSAKLSAPLSGRIDIDRKLLAKNLISAIEGKSNIQIYERATVTDPVIKGDTVVGVKFIQDKEEKTLHARLIVDATGFNAVLRKKVGERLGFETELEPFDTFITFRKYIKRPDNYPTKEYKVFFGKYQGVAWINSELDNMIDILAAIPKSPTQKNPKEIVQELESFIVREMGGSIDLTPVRANYGGILPTRRCLDKFCADGFLLMGDSACQIEPINGSGIASGMLAGYLAAKTVNTLFKNRREFSQANLWPYMYDWISTIGAQYASIDILRLFLLSKTEDDFNFVIKHKIITEDELRKSMIGEKIRISLVELLRKLFYGITRLGLLLDLNSCIKDADKIREIYLQYPKEFDAEQFDLWQQSRDKIVNKYYRKLK